MVCQHDVVDFIKKHMPSYEKYTDEVILKIIDDHIKYGTYDEMRNSKGELIAVVRYNVDGMLAKIADLIIEQGYDSLYIIRRLVVRGWSNFPYLRYVSFYRGYKYPHRKLSILPIRRILKVKEEN